MGGPPVVFRFGPFELDTAGCQLRHGGAPIEVPSRLLDLLERLVSRPGDLLTKEELIAGVWPGVYVTDNSLTRAVSDLRRVLGDDPAHPSCIQTVARRGYRFIAAVQTAARTTSPVGLDGGVRDPLAAYKAWADGRLQLESLSVDALPPAVAAFEHQRAASPTDALVRIALANAYLLQFEATRAHAVPDRSLLVRAVAEAREACQLDGSLGEAWATLGFVLAASGDPDARGAARRAVAMEPDNWRHHFRYGFAVWGEDRLRSVGRALALYPPQPFAYLLSAMVFVARGALEAAERALEEGVRLQDLQQDRATVFPAAGLHWLRGLVLAACDRADEALVEYARECAFERTPTVYATEFAANALVARGCLLLSKADMTSAITAFREALDRQPGQARAHLGLAVAHAALGEPDASSRAHQAATQALDDLRAAGRRAEAGIVEASMLVTQHQPDRAAAVVERMLSDAPPGPAGWSVPVEPFLRPLLDTAAFTRVRAMLAERAA